MFFNVGSSATLGTTTNFLGNILAQASITLTTGANITGRLLASTAAVTLDTNLVTKPAVIPVTNAGQVTIGSGKHQFTIYGQRVRVQDTDKVLSTIFG